MSACGGGGGSSNSGNTSMYTGKTSQANIDVLSVKNTLASVGDVFPSCTATGVSPKTVNANAVYAVLNSAKRIMPLVSAKRVGKSAGLIATTAPTASTGACGGTLSYPTYSHASGTTTMTVKWDNYCSIDSATGNKTTMNGTLSAVDAGTPGASGPVTTKLTASIPGLTVIEKNSAGTVISNETIILNGFEYVPASGASNSNLSGSTKFAAVELKDGIKNKVYKLENVIITSGKVGTDTQLSVSGRIYRDTSGYSELTTDVPFRMYSSNNLRAGKVTFTGANNHKATLTAVPGAGQKFTVEVDGTPISGAQLTCNGL